VQGIACGTHQAGAYFSTDDDGRLVKVESQGNSIVMNLGDMRICCRRGMWAPF
jgi:DNA-directed RNA polymerase subunit N (RpoN/RPB10)